MDEDDAQPVQFSRAELSGSVAGAASDASATNMILRAGAVLAFIGAAGLLAMGRRQI